MNWRGILGGRQDGWGRRVWDVVLGVAAFGALVLAAGLYARFGFGTLAGISSDSMKPHMDFDVFRHSARALWDGRNIYYGTGGPMSARSRRSGPCLYHRSLSLSRSPLTGNSSLSRR